MIEPAGRRLSLLVLLGLVVSALYAGFFLLVSAVVVWLTGDAGTGRGWLAMAVATVAFAAVASWRTQPYIDRLVRRILPGRSDQ